MITLLCFFFFKQKTAYEIRPCDWSSDVCSSDLEAWLREPTHGIKRVAHDGERHVVARGREVGDALPVVRRGIVAERGRGGLAGAVDPSGDVDLIVQDGGGQLLDRLRKRRGSGPAAVALEHGRDEQ